MGQYNSGRVRLLEMLPAPGAQQCLRLALCGPQRTEAMPGQYCLLTHRNQRWLCGYISLPGAAGRFIVATHQAQALGQVEALLGYSGPLGNGWPIPLQCARLLAVTRGEGVLTLLCALDEIRCWLPWVQVRLLHEGFALEHLPLECLAWASTLSTLPRKSCSGWLQLAHQLEAFRPDTVFCCAPPQVARQVARTCWQKGVAPQCIWLRTDHVHDPITDGYAALAGPVQRYDRVLAALRWAPPAG
ncbi:hypothetical protein [Pseudomonas sp. UFMG81]|uniref:hypothetical protein n=1 Tax=Pseudomonas sp. UFMG81 TaxID=2745936 RepID=UPI00188EC676|nr:hypothetical protein [Pseudomonas sp. UFMG81]